jgi:hypothetical protein
MWWTTHIEGGPRRVNHAAVSVGDRIFSFGGYCTGDNYRDRRPIDVFVLNTLNLRWSEVPKPEPGNPNLQFCPFQRYGHTVIAFGDLIYLFGGRNDESACNVLFQFDTTTCQWSIPKVQGDIPAERDGHSACVVGAFMYIFGGYEEIIERFGQDVYRLDLRTFAWKLLICRGDPPVQRDFHSATAIHGNMFIFGGRSDLTGIGMGPDFYSNKVCYLDTQTLVWHNPSIVQGSQHPCGRRSHSALNLDGRLLIFGGYNGRSKNHMNDLWLLDQDSWRWEQIIPFGAPAPNPRRRQSLCRVGSKIYLFGGTSPYTGPPLFFTPEQLAMLPQQDEDNSTKLMDHNDLYVLDLNPSLKTLAMLQVKNNQLSTEGLPATILRELFYMSACNKISKPLKTVESLTSG